jgi:DNA repair protein RadD
LGGIFKELVECPQIGELIHLGHLVGTKVYAPSVPDLTGVRTRAGDYNEEQLAVAMDRSALVGDIVTHWHRLANCRPTVVFATSVGHSVHIRDEFKKSGVKAEHIDGSTPHDERDYILHRLSTGNVELVSNCMVLTEGWDAPAVSCIVLARPMKSEGLYPQMAGRVLRTFPGKDHALVIDHSGATYEHGFVEEPRQWTLDPDKKVRNLKDKALGSKPNDRLCECKNCGALRTAGDPCGNCGFFPRRAAAYLHIRDGQLYQLERDGIQHTPATPEEMAMWHAMLVYECQQRGYKDGWAAYKFKERFGQWPPRTKPEPERPTPEVTSWIRSRNIAFAKSQQKATANA